MHDETNDTDVNTPIVIGGPKYNIATGKEGNTTYLYLLAFAQNENSEITDQSDLEQLINTKLVRKVPLPEGGGSGGGSSSTSSYSAITRQIGETELMISTADTDSVIIKLFF